MSMGMGVPLQQAVSSFGGAGTGQAGTFLVPGMMQQQLHHQQQQLQYGYVAPPHMIPLHAMQQRHQLMHHGPQHMPPHHQTGIVPVQMHNGVQSSMYMDGTPAHVQAPTSMYALNAQQKWVTNVSEGATGNGYVNGFVHMPMQQLEQRHFS